MKNEVKEIRKILEKSQAQLARDLNVTQATISRLESGKMTMTSDIYKKLLNLLNIAPQATPRLPKENSLARYQFEEKFHNSENGWNSFQVTSLNQADNSDLILVSNLDKSIKTPFLIGDMTGHGSDSAYMAFAIKFAFQAFLGLIRPDMISVELINSFIAQGIRLTKTQWKNNPSLITGLVSEDRSLDCLEIEYINNGMPHPLSITSKGSKFYEKGRYSAIDINSVNTNFKMSKIQVFKGESLVFFSDGLLDILPENLLVKYANEDLQYFKGDSRAIGKNILRAIKSRLSDLRDDISFLVFSVKQ